MRDLFHQGAYIDPKEEIQIVLKRRLEAIGAVFLSQILEKRKQIASIDLKLANKGKITAGTQ